MKNFLLVTLLAVVSLALPFRAAAYTNGQNAFNVIGQADYTSSSANRGGSASSITLNYPYGAVVADGKLIVSEYSNNRVLIWNEVPTSLDVEADLVLGQDDFTSTSANRGGSVAANTLSGPLGVDSDGTKLFVSDYDNHRVLVWNTFPTTNGQAADAAIGQVDLTSNSNNGFSADRDGLLWPYDVAYDDATGGLAIADNGNSRIVIFTTAPTTSDPDADYIADEANFTSGTTDVGPANIAYPTGVDFINGKLYVSDNRNNRVAVYDSIPDQFDETINRVIGQDDFISDSPDQGGSPAADTLDGPDSVAFDGTYLFVRDSDNSRILIYDGEPTSNGESAIGVIGQDDFTSSSAHQGGSAARDTLSASEGTIATYGDKLVVVDPGPRRVLLFDNDNYPVISNFSASGRGQSFNFSWTSEFLADGVLEWGTTSALGNTVTVNGTSSTYALSHSPSVTTDSACNPFYYRYSSTNEDLAATSSGTIFVQDSCTGNFSSSPDSTDYGVCHDTPPQGNVELFQIDRQGDSATLYFSPISSGVAEYHVVYGYNQGDERFGGLSMATTGIDQSGVQQITVDNLDPKQSYSFQLIAVNGCASGDRSNWLTSKAATKGFDFLF